MILLLLAACPRTISPELEITPPQAAAVELGEPEEIGAWRAWILRGDPLGRRARVPQRHLDPGLDRWLSSAGHDAEPEAWWQAESESRGTGALPLLRGARLAAAEVVVHEPGQLLRWFVPLGESKGPPVEHPRAAFAWAGTPGEEGTLAAIERSVLLGWLDGPDISTDAVASLLAQPEWARLASLPASLILRGRTQSAPAPVDSALRDLDEATTFAVHQAAADRPDEYADVRAEREALGAALGEDPIAVRLLRALPVFAAAAGLDENAGFALVSHAALRWGGRCTDLPCAGLDRADEWATASRWGPNPARYAGTWRAIAWKGAVDELWSAWDRPQVVSAMDRVVELIATDSPRALDLSALLHASPEPAWILPITRAIGPAEGTSRVVLFRDLYARVATEAARAAAADPARSEALGRIAARAKKQSL